MRGGGEGLAFGVGSADAPCARWGQGLETHELREGGNGPVVISSEHMKLRRPVRMVWTLQAGFQLPVRTRNQHQRVRVGDRVESSTWVEVALRRESVSGACRSRERERLTMEVQMAAPGEKRPEGVFI